MSTRRGSAYVATPKQSRAILTGAKDCFTGIVPSQKEGNEYRLIGYEGTLERDFIYLLEDDDNVVSYQEQDVKLRWHDGDRWRRYTPDFCVQYGNGWRVCVEVKPLDIVEKLDLLPVYALIQHYALASKRYDEFQLWTDEDIRETHDLANAELRFSERHQHDGETEGMAVRTAFARLNGRATVARLRFESGLGERAYRGILRLMAEGDCQLENPDQLIEDDSVVLWKAVA